MARPDVERLLADALARADLDARRVAPGLPEELCDPAEVFDWSTGHPVPVRAPVDAETLPEEHTVHAALAGLGSAIGESTRRHSWFRLRRRTLGWAAAAASLLLFLGGGIGVASIVLKRRPILLLTTGSRGTRAAEFGLNSTLDLEAAGVAPEAVVEDWARFLLPGGMGTAIVVRSRVLDLFGFGPDGELLWSAREWPDSRHLLEADVLGFKWMRCLVTRREGGRMEESLCLVLSRGRESCLLIVDPVGGQPRGAFVYRGDLGVGDGECLASVPDLTERPRRLLIGGNRGTGKWRRPILAVVELDGTLVQHFEFPHFGAVGRDGNYIRHIQTDWSEDRLEITVQSREALFFSFLVQDRMLAPETRVVDDGGGLRKGFDHLHGEGAIDVKIDNEYGGWGEFRRRLREETRLTDPGPGRSTWCDQ